MYITDLSYFENLQCPNVCNLFYGMLLVLLSQLLLTLFRPTYFWFLFRPTAVFLQHINRDIQHIIIRL